MARIIIIGKIIYTKFSESYCLLVVILHRISTDNPWVVTLQNNITSKYQTVDGKTWDVSNIILAERATSDINNMLYKEQSFGLGPGPNNPGPGPGPVVSKNMFSLVRRTNLSLVS